MDKVMEVEVEKTNMAKLRVRALRIERGLSVAQLAEKSGVSHGTVLLYDRDQGAYMRKDKLAAIAAALDVPVSKLFDD